MERIINTRLNWLLETNIMIANVQAGFRIQRSTSEHTAKFSQFIKDALDNKRISTAVFINFKSAYDSVWKENLLLKLVRSRIRSNLIHWLESFISHRACKVRYGENRGADKSLVRPGRKQATATEDFDFHIS